MSADLVSILSALVVAVLCAFGPRLIARLPEPELEVDAAGEQPVADETAAGDPASSDRPTPNVRADSPMAGAPPVPKVPYAELAARPALAVKFAVAGAVAGGVIGYALPDDPIVVAWLYLAVVGVILGYIDVQTRLLPTRILAPSYAVLVALILLAALLDGGRDDLLRSASGWAVYGGFFFLMWVVYPRGLGYGDVRLSGLLGLALGYAGWGELVVGMYAGLLLGGIIGGVLALAQLVDRKRYPFGPFMLVGALVGLLAGGPVADWYTGL